MRVHRVAKQRIVAADGLRHLLGLLFPLRGAALDVGEEERQGRGFGHDGVPAAPGKPQPECILYRGARMRANPNFLHRKPRI
jgi:hypothetical protein